MHKLLIAAICILTIVLIGMSQNRVSQASVSQASVPQQAATDPVPVDATLQEFSTPELIDQALARGEITKEERLLLLAYAIYEPAQLPERYQSTVGWYGTQYVRELYELRPSLETQQSVAAQEVVEILAGAVSTYCDSDDGPNTIDSTYFRISYGTIGGGLTANDYATSLDTTYQIEVTDYGWATPPLASANTFGKYPVQVANLGGGLYGYVTTAGGLYTEFIGDNPNTPEIETDSLATCMVLNDDFSQFPEGAQGGLDSTTSHEYVHAIQFAYGDPFPFEDSMWYESVAAYMEDEIFDNANSDYQYLWPVTNNCLGEWPDNGAPGGVSQYSNFTFFRHVAEHNGGTNQPGGGEDIAQTLWKNIGAGQSGLDAYNNALVSEGTDSTNLNDAFHKYAIAIKSSKACGGGYAAPYCFEEGADYVTYQSNQLIDVQGTVAAVPGNYNGSVRDNYAANYVALPNSGTYKVSLQNTAAGGQLRGSVVCDTGTSFNIVPFPSVAGSGATSEIASFAATGCVNVVAVITNQSQTASEPATCTSRSYTLAVQTVVNPPTATPSATATHTSVPPTATPTVTNTPVPPTATSTPTHTSVPPTATPSATATGTSAPPTATPTGTPTTGSQPGNCNSDAAVDAGDISAVILEIFDGDGTGVATVAGGTFPGGPGCDANEDTAIDAADISCTVLLIFNGPNACSDSPNAAAQTSAQLTVKDTHVDWAAEAATVDIVLTSRGHAASAVAFVVNYDATELRFDTHDRNGDGVPDAVTVPFVTDGKHVTVTDRGGQLAIALADITAAPTGFADGPLLTISFGVDHPVGSQAVTSALAFSQEEAVSLGSVAGTVIPVTTQDGLVTVAPVEIVSQIYLPFLIGAE